MGHLARLERGCLLSAAGRGMRARGAAGRAWDAKHGWKGDAYLARPEGGCAARPEGGCARCGRASCALAQVAPDPQDPCTRRKYPPCA